MSAFRRLTVVRRRCLDGVWSLQGLRCWRSTLSVGSHMSQPLSECTSPSHLRHVGGKEIPLTSKLHIVKPTEGAPRGVWPAFRLLDENGTLRTKAAGEKSSSSSVAVENKSDGGLDGFREALIDECGDIGAELQHCRLLHTLPRSLQLADQGDSADTLGRAHRHLIRLRQMDDIFLNAQRQGRLSFYLACLGEEATHIGSAASLDADDVVLAQYREQGILQWRGFTAEQFANQCTGNDLDLGKGRQMPIHYGSRALRYHTISSPLGTQLPQAVGVAYKMKLDNATSKTPTIAIAYFGEGCTSGADFHSACNFASTLGTPVIFLCRNNGYAISTPTTQQFAGDGVVARAPGYGMAAIRVDGNDILAVSAAVDAARQYCLQENAPVLMELITYRRGHHSTSDDSTRYRSVTSTPVDATHSVTDVSHERSDPLHRFQMFLERYGCTTPEETEQIRHKERRSILKALQVAEKRPKSPLQNLFTDVYHEMPPHLRRQEEELLRHLQK